MGTVVSGTLKSFMESSLLYIQYVANDFTFFYFLLKISSGDDGNIVLLWKTHAHVIVYIQNHTICIYILA